uniref:Uncharacterized protein n=1 Tax=Megaselia scalaris TaxID=36166 RepID=T1GMW0_MEGSC
MTERLPSHISPGPGPGAYLLPSTIGYISHDVRKERSPMYTFGKAQLQSEPSDSPGPGGGLLFHE